MSDKGGLTDRLRWKASAGELSGVLAPDQTLAANTDMTLCVVLQNPAQHRPCPDASVVMELTEEKRRIAMTSAEMGVEHPACAGYVETVRFPLAAVHPSTNATNAISTLFVELSPNMPITSGSIVLSGMYGYKRIADDDKAHGPVAIEVTKNGLLDTETLEAEAHWDGISILSLRVKTGARIGHAIAVPSTLAFPSEADVIVVKLQMRNGKEQAPYDLTVRATQYDMVPWAVDVGPEDTRVGVIVVPIGVAFTYNDWLENKNKELGVILTFSDGPDGAQVVLPAEFAFPEWLRISGREREPAIGESFGVGWPLTKDQLASTLLELEVRGSETEVVLLDVRSSVLRDVDAALVPEIENQYQGRRRLLESCPPGYETRLMPLGAPLAALCNCPAECEDTRASCTVTGSGTFGAFLVSETLCNEVLPESRAAMLLSIVVGIFLIIVFGTIAYLYHTMPDLFGTGKDSSESEDDENDDGKGRASGSDDEDENDKANSVDCFVPVGSAGGANPNSMNEPKGSQE